MKQFQTVFENEDSFRTTIAEWKAWQTEHSCRQVLFHICPDGAKDEDVRLVRDIVERMMFHAVLILNCHALESLCTHEAVR